MTPRTNKFMMGAFFIALAIYLIWNAINRPRIFVLQSYSENYLWTKNVNDAIHSVFDTSFYDVKYHFMDTKRHSDPDFKRIAGSLARKQINDWKPDILIAVDDNAQSLVSSCYIDNSKVATKDRENISAKTKDILGRCFPQHPDLKIIFSGIGAEPKDYGFRGQENVTGILERMDVPALSEALLIIANKMDKKKLRVVAPIDDSTSGVYNTNSLKRLKQEMLSFNISVDIQVLSTFKQWQQTINDANNNADVLLFSNYHTIKCNDKKYSKHVPPNKLIEWTNHNSDIIGLGAWGFYFANGGMFAVGVSPFEQGKIAARMALDIIENNTIAKDINIETTHQSIIFMRQVNMLYHDLKMPRIYEAFARATGNYLECSDKTCTKDLNKLKAEKNNSIVNICNDSQ